MTKPVRTNPFAGEDILQYVGHYEAQSAHLGELLWNEIQASFKLVSEYPLIGEVVPRARLRGTARRIPLRRFPFFVIYRDLEDHIEVMPLHTQVASQTTGVPGSIDPRSPAVNRVLGSYPNVSSIVLPSNIAPLSVAR